MNHDKVMRDKREEYGIFCDEVPVLAVKQDSII